MSCEALSGPENRPALVAFRSPSEEGRPSALSPLMQQFSAVRILLPRGHLAVSGEDVFGFLGGQPTWDRHYWQVEASDDAKQSSRHRREPHHKEWSDPKYQ